MTGTAVVSKVSEPGMKDSGVEWIGKIPEGWESARLKALFGFRKGLSITKANLVEDGVRVISYGQVHAKYNRSTGIVDDLFRFVPESFLESNPECLVKKGDFIFTDTSEDLEGLCDFVHVDRDEQIFAGYHSIIFDNKNEQNGRYLAYLFMTDCWRNQFRCNAMAVKVFSLTQSVLKQATVILPPKEVQDRIAVFLDKKCNAIDSLISAQKNLVTKLKEYRQSLITEAVTKGLDPNAPMKDSGVEWIMKIPESWESARLKALFGFRKGLSITKANLVEDGVRVISYGQVHAKYNRSTGIVDDLFRFVPESFLESNPECLVKKGDFIFTDTSEDLEGLCDFVHVDRDEQIFAGYHSIIFDNKNEQNGRYLAYLFMTDCWRNQFRCNAMAVKVFSLTQSVLKQATVILPPKEVQDRIAVFLDKKCNAINSLILKINQNISKLSEIKQSLIYEYVTGKKQVPAEALE